MEPRGSRGPRVADGDYTVVKPVPGVGVGGGLGELLDGSPQAEAAEVFDPLRSLS